MNEFSRFFLFPGGYHCSGGEGPFNFDLLMPIMRWVETGMAPDEIIASHSKRGEPGPGTSGPVDKTRPIFPYPDQAKYTGTGSIDEAENFKRARGHNLPADRLQWARSSFYAPRYETWCTVAAGEVRCTLQNR